MGAVETLAACVAWLEVEGEEDRVARVSEPVGTGEAEAVRATLTLAGDVGVESGPGDAEAASAGDAVGARKGVGVED